MSRSRLVLITLLLLTFFLLIHGARRLSFTIDEPSHLVSGYTFLSDGLQGIWTIARRNHPLLIDAWEAFPLFVAEPDIPLQEIEGFQKDFTTYTKHVMKRFYPVESIEIAGRAQASLLTILLVAVAYRWGKDMGGSKVGLLAVTLLAFEPNLLAHGRIATNDVGLTALGTLTLFIGWRWWRRPSWSLTLLMSLLVTATLLAKASGVFYAAAFGLGILLAGVLTHKEKKFWYKFGSIVAFSFLWLWAAYGFSWGPLTPDTPISVPAFQHWKALFTQNEKAGERFVFAFGMRRHGHWWWYFPLAFVIKSPVPLLILLVGAITLWLRTRLKSGIYAVIPSIFALLYGGVAVGFGMNIGYRHLLPILPFLVLFISKTVMPTRKDRWRYLLIGLLITWQILGTLRVTPNEITYFNEFVGGPKHGYRYLVDSNLDWGQSYKALKDWLNRHPGDRPKMAYFTLIPPEAYGIDYTAIAPTPGGEPITPTYRPAPGRYVISPNFLQGIFGPHDEVYSWFLNFEPTAKVGNALFVYDVPPYYGRWIAQCNKPIVPLDTEAMAFGLGTTSLRQVNFDCENAWIYPTGGKEVGWHVLSGDKFSPNGLRQQLLYAPPTPRDAFHQRHLQISRFAYQQEAPGTSPPFVLYETTDTLSISKSRTSSPATSLSGPLDFIGSYTIEMQAYLEVETWWRVTEHPIVRPFSIMAHLMDEDNVLVANADGLGITPPALQTGDILVQRHQFTMSDQEKPQLQLRVGAYWLDTMERWQLRDGSDHIVLKAIASGE